MDPPENTDYIRALYSEERVARWIRGEISLQELMAVSGPEMLKMAQIGFRMYEIGRYEEAENIFRGLGTLDPKQSYYQTALGAVFLARDDLPNAEAALTKAIALNPTEIASYVNRGEVFLRQGKTKEAIADLKKAVALDKAGTDPLAKRARVLAEAAQQSLSPKSAEATVSKKVATPSAPSKPPPAKPKK